MSRCVLDDEKRGTEVVVGWDPPIGTFFAHVRERAQAQAQEHPAAV